MRRQRVYEFAATSNTNNRSADIAWASQVTVANVAIIYFRWLFRSVQRWTNIELSLYVYSSAGECSVAEVGGVAWGSETGGAGEERRYAQLMERLHHHQAERGEHTQHVQLRYVGERDGKRGDNIHLRTIHVQCSRSFFRYFLQLMTEASCVEWAVMIAIVLRDALAVLRTTNAARAGDVSIDAARRLRRTLQDICAWTEVEW